MDAHHERLNFQMTRISEVNQHLNALMETSEKVSMLLGRYISNMGKKILYDCLFYNS